MKYTIEDFKRGKCIIKNDGTVDELNKVLQKAIPGTNLAAGYSNYYECRSARWYGIDSSHGIPVQSVKDFLTEEWEPKWGNKVISRIDRSIYTFVAIHPEHRDKAIVIEDDGSITWVYAPVLLPSPSTIEITLKEIAEKFNIPVNLLRIKDK